MAIVVKNPPANGGDIDFIHVSGRSLEKEMASHSSILAWEFLQIKEPGGLWFMELQKTWTLLSV